VIVILYYISVSDGTMDGRWELPPWGGGKINCDGSLDGQNGEAGFVLTY